MLRIGGINGDMRSGGPSGGIDVELTELLDFGICRTISED